MGDAKSSLGDAESSLGDAASSLGDAKSSLGDAESSLGDAKSSLGDAESSLGDAESSLGDAKSSLGDAKSSLWQPFCIAARRLPFRLFCLKRVCVSPLYYQVFLKLGGFPEDFGYALEDWELFSKVVLSGYKLETIPDPLYWYRLRETSHSRMTAQQGNPMRTIRPYLKKIPPHLHHLVLFAQVRPHTAMPKLRVEMIGEARPAVAVA
jgi:hypothetical protein